MDRTLAVSIPFRTVRLCIWWNSIRVCEKQKSGGESSSQKYFVIFRELKKFKGCSDFNLRFRTFFDPKRSKERMV